jgi:putative endonuclease
MGSSYFFVKNMSHGFVYILQSKKSGHYYIGASEDPLRRLKEHNAGKVKSTRKKGPWEIKFDQKFCDIKKAKQIEYRLKKLKKRDIIEKIIKDRIILLN